MSFNITTNNVENYANLASFPATGQDNIIYIDTATNTAYYWNGVDYQSISGGGGTGGTFAVDLDDSLTNISRAVFGGITRFTVNHNLNTKQLIAFIYEISTENPVFLDYTLYNNHIELEFGGTVLNNVYKLVIKY